MRAKATAGDEGKRVLNALRQLVRALRLFDREAQSRYGLTAAQIYVLHTLQSSEDPLSLNELAERTATDQSSASVVVQKLVDSDLVTRSPRREDRRQVELRLTARGRAAARNAPEPAQQRILGAIEAMSPADRKRFAALFESFVGAMGATGSHPPMLFEDDPPGARPRRPPAKSKP